MRWLSWLALQAAIIGLWMLAVTAGNPEAPGLGLGAGLVVGVMCAALATGGLSRSLDWFRYAPRADVAHWAATRLALVAGFVTWAYAYLPDELPISAVVFTGVASALLALGAYNVAMLFIRSWRDQPGAGVRPEVDQGGGGPGLLNPPGVEKTLEKRAGIRVGYDPR